MLDEYFIGSVNQLIERARCLKSKIPRNLPRDYDVLERTASDRLAAILKRLRQLIDDSSFSRPEFTAERLRIFRRLVADMDLIESYAIAALERAIHSDQLLNELLECITKEIAYPHPTPVVSALSQRYFCILSELNLLCVPLAEGDFLLHLPDLYHELAHPLLLVADDPVIEPIQKSYERALGYVFDWLTLEIEKESARRGPAQMGFLLELWQVSWVKSWMSEFFCDLYGIYTLGPAFAWSHLHLFAKRGGDPYDAPMAVTSHPADDARMSLMLRALHVTGFDREADQIKIRWGTLLEDSGAVAEPEYRRCFPDSILSQLALIAFDGVKGINARIATSATNDRVHSLLNVAWQQFWADPTHYPKWEATAVADLRLSFGQRIRG